MSALVRDPWLWALAGCVAVAVWAGLRKKRRLRLARGEAPPLAVRGGRPK